MEINTPVGHLALLTKYSIHRGFRGHLKARVSQPGHDLAGRQVLEGFAVERSDHPLAFVLAQLVRGTRMAPLARGALVTLKGIGALPTLHAARCTLRHDDRPT